MHSSVLLSLLLLPLYTDRWTATSTPLKLPTISESFTDDKPSGPSIIYSRSSSRRDYMYPFNGFPVVEIIGAGWAAASFENDYLYPSHDTDKLLADFYHSVVSMCMAMTASNTPPAPYGGTFKLGGLELAFDSTGNPIPWSLLRAFADFMLLTTDHGFSSTYTMWLTHLVSGQAIRFMLRVGQGGPPLIS